VSRFQRSSWQHLIAVSSPEWDPDKAAEFIRAELDKVALAHSTFTDDALGLVVRSTEGVLRRARNLCLRALLEAVRDRTKTVDLKQVNRVLLQPHWCKETDLPH
jgi:hypothetical protein